MFKFALLGAGRIGKMHADNIMLNPQCDLEIVYDINKNAAGEISNKHKCKILCTLEIKIRFP